MNIAIRIIHCLWIRQMRGYWRSWARVVSSLVHPILYLTTLGAGLGPIFRRAGEGNYLRFLSPGIIAMSILFAATFSGTDLLWERRFGILKEAFVAPVPRWFFIFGRALGSSSVAMIQGLIVAGICLCAGMKVHALNVLPAVLLIMSLLAMLFASFGLVLGSLMSDHNGFQMVMNVLILPMTFLSGAFYPLRNLPPVLHFLARIDPLSYGVDALRLGLGGGVQQYFLRDVEILGALTLFTLALATVSFARLKL